MSRAADGAMQHRAPGRRAGPALALLLALLPGLALPALLPAQQVQGRVLDAVDGQPLAGAYVALVRDSAVVASTVTRVDGFFRLIGPETGSYLLRADQLGYAVVEEGVILPPPGEPLQVELLASAQAIELEGLVAEVDRRCRVPRPIAVQVAELWDEVAEAFRVAALMEEREIYDMRLEMWERSLEPRTLRVLEESRREVRGIQRGSPFNSVPPEELAREGYVRELESGGFHYFAPDARVLLSPSFQASHCFGFTAEPPDDGDEDWVGIRFAPRNDDRPEIRGVLWIDGPTLQPRRLDFDYTELPGRVGSEDLGGRVVFQRLPDGPWIVREWWIRMPRVQGEQFYVFDSSTPRYRYEITGIEEAGGRVTRAGPRGGTMAVLGEVGRLEGVVRDASGAPVEGASVGLDGTAYRTRTGTGGAFVLDQVPGGRYRLMHTSPRLDSLELDGGGTPVVVEPGETARVDVLLPSAAELLAAACTEPLVPEEAGVLRGVVLERDSTPVPGARVELSWMSSLRVGDAGARVAVTRGRSTATLPVGADGRWGACGLPEERPITVRAFRSADEKGAGSSREVLLSRSELALLELTVPPSGAADFVGAAEEDAAGDDPTEEAGAVGLPTAEGRMTEELSRLGLRPETLGRRYADPRRLAQVREGSMDAVDMVRVLGLPGIRVRRLPSDGAGDQLCVFSRRNTRNSFSAGPSEPICAAIVVDGVPTDMRQLQSIPGDQVAALAYLRPAEAGARFGGGTDGGVLVVWTVRGGR